VDWGLLRIDDVPDDRTITIGRGAKPSVEPNDDLVGISETAERLGPMPAIETVERDNGRPQEIVFEEPISEVLSPGDHVANLATANQGYVIRNNTVRNSRARPIRVTSPEGAIIGNTIDGCNGAGIQLHSIVNGTFPPKGYVEDVVVEDNTIERAGLVGIANRKLAPRAIRCVAQSGEGSVTGQPHRNVRLIGNEIDGTAMEGIEVSHTRGVEIEDTTIADPNQLAGESYGIVMDAVNDAEISGTIVSGASETLVQFCGVRESRNVTLSGNSLSIDGEEEPPKEVDR
jgi:hypothetical protein